MKTSPDLNLLVVLDTLIAEGSVTRAAKRLNLSAPATSRALRRAFATSSTTRSSSARARPKQAN